MGRILGIIVLLGFLPIGTCPNYIQAFLLAPLPAEPSDSGSAGHDAGEAAEHESGAPRDGTDSDNQPDGPSGITSKPTEPDSRPARVPGAGKPILRTGAPSAPCPGCKAACLPRLDRVVAEQRCVSRSPAVTAGPIQSHAPPRTV